MKELDLNKVSKIVIYEKGDDDHEDLQGKIMKLNEFIRTVYDSNDEILNSLDADSTSGTGAVIEKDDIRTSLNLLNYQIKKDFLI